MGFCHVADGVSGARGPPAPVGWEPFVIIIAYELRYSLSTKLRSLAEPVDGPPRHAHLLTE
jgi:hypothetical protein